MTRRLGTLLVSAAAGALAHGAPAVATLRPAPPAADPAPATGLPLPAELADAGLTIEMLAARSAFAKFHPEDLHPSAQPAVRTARSGGPGRDTSLAGVGVLTEQEFRPVRGFVTLPPWAEGEVIYRYSPEIIDLVLNPPPDPDPNQLNAMQAVPNLSFIFFYVQQVTHGRVKFIGYDPAVHTGDGYVLIESNGPEGTCFNVSATGYLANADDGQLFNCCEWNSFPAVLSLAAFTLGLDREHQRPDRDQYIKVNFENVGPAEIFGGLGVSTFQIDSTGPQPVGEYDYGALQHFSQFQSSVNLLPTIEVKTNAAWEWLQDHPIVEQNLVILFPDIIDTIPGDPAYKGQLVEALQMSIGTGGALSDGDIETLYVLYGRPGQPYPWVFDPLARCPTDVNGDGRVTPTDLQAFLDLLYSQSIYADLNGDGMWNSQDFLVFHGAFNPGYCNTVLVPAPPRRPTLGPIEQ